MTSSDPACSVYSHVIDVVRRRDVEAYAYGRLRNAETARLVERVLLEDDAARAIIRGALSRSDEAESDQSQRLPFKPLQDLSTAVRSCRALAETYDCLHAHTDHTTASKFLRGRATAFREAAEKLTTPLREQLAEIPDAWPEQTTPTVAESRDSLVRQICTEPPQATRRLADLHRPLMQGLRTLIHSPWPLRIKLLIADTYALLTEELESSTWRLKRQLFGR